METRHLVALAERLLTLHPLLVNEFWMGATYQRQFRHEKLNDRAHALVEAGEFPGFSPTPLFDPIWYRDQVDCEADASANGVWLLDHFLTIGLRRGLTPNAFFPTTAYLARNPDLKPLVSSNRTSLLLDHLLTKEALEQRHLSLFFDPEFYRRRAQLDTRSLRQAGVDEFGRYITKGYRQGLPPNSFFDEDWYLGSRTDARDLVARRTYPNGFSHFLQEGESLSYAPNPFMDPLSYLTLNRDVAAAVKAGRISSAVAHMVSTGLQERRALSSSAVANFVTRFFPSDLPTSRPVPSDSRLTIPANRLFEIAEGYERAGKPFPPEFRQLVQRYVSERGEPDIRIFASPLPDLHPGETTSAHIVGVSTLPFSRLTTIRGDSPTLSIGTEMVRMPYPKYFEGWQPPGFSTPDLLLGFYCRLDITCPTGIAGVQQVTLDFEFECGEDIKEFTYPAIGFMVRPPPVKSDSGQRVQVCMATYNPPKEALSKQVDSILGQSDPDFSLLISDDDSDPAARQALRRRVAGDPRIHLSLHDQNVGFTGNFERAVRAVSDHARYVCLSDQDDVWYPTKVAALRKALTSRSVTCCYSDMRITRPDDAVIADTFWSNRSNHYRSPAALAVANTITGASAMFSAAFLRTAIPFPRFIGLFHDQWLSVAAAATGKIRYLDTALYDYVQHSRNVLGFRGSRGGDLMYWRLLWRNLNRARRIPPEQWTERQVGYFLLALESCHIVLVQRLVLLDEALRRFPRWQEADARQFAQQFCDAVLRPERPIDILGLLRGAGLMRRQAHGDAGLLGNDEQLKCALCALLLLRADPHAMSRPAIKSLVADSNDRQAMIDDDASPTLTQFERKIRALRIEQSNAAEAPRINLLVPELKLATFFGGYYGKLALAQQIHRAGYAVRLILLDQERVDYDEVLQIANAFPDLAPGLDVIPVEAAGLRTAPVGFHRNDVVVATTWWSAHVAAQLCRDLGRREFVYFIQEYEPFTFPLGTWYRAAEESYDFAHRAVFSTDFLADYFRENRLGMFRGGARVEDRDYLVFKNPITAPGLSARTRKPGAPLRLLFYARPQLHAARNMYEYGLAALRLLVARWPERCVNWEFVGIGAPEAGQVELGPGHALRMVEKLNAAEYRDILGTADAGLALMYTPHPSLVPLEMAAAGLLTVTNACMTKQPHSFADISRDITVAPPTIAGIAEALAEALAAAATRDGPSAPIDWPTTPEQAFPSAWIERFVAIAKQPLMNKPHESRLRSLP